MADKKFSQFTAKPTPAQTDEVVGFSGVDNIRVPVSAFATGAEGDKANTAVQTVNLLTGPAVVLDTDDIADTATNRYVTDADLVKLGNLSGTNTGDQETTGVLPIVVGSGTTDPVISVNLATTGTDGTITGAEKVKLNNLSGTNTGDQTTSGTAPINVTTGTTNPNINLSGTKAEFDAALEDGAFVYEAPIDGTQYGRKDAGWTPVAAGGAPLTTQVDGVPQSTGTTLYNFTGAGVVVTEPIPDQFTITIAGGGVGTPLIIEENGTPLADEPALNFDGDDFDLVPTVGVRNTVNLSAGARTSLDLADTSIQRIRDQIAGDLPFQPTVEFSNYFAVTDNVVDSRTKVQLATSTLTSLIRADNSINEIDFVTPTLTGTIELPLVTASLKGYVPPPPAGTDSRVFTAGLTWEEQAVSPVGGAYVNQVWSDDITATQPGSGGIKGNNADQTLITEIYVSTETFPANDSGFLWESLQTGQYLGIWQTDKGSDGTEYYLVDGPAVLTVATPNWYTVPVSHLTGNGLLQNGSAVQAFFIANPNQQLPEGGTLGQVLAKASATNYDTEWVDGGGQWDGTSGLNPVLGGDLDANNFAITDPLRVQVAGKATPYVGSESLLAFIDITKNLTWNTDNGFAGLATMAPGVRFGGEQLIVPATVSAYGLGYLFDNAAIITRNNSGPVGALYTIGAQPKFQAKSGSVITQAFQTDIFVSSSFQAETGGSIEITGTLTNLSVASTSQGTGAYTGTTTIARRIGVVINQFGRATVVTDQIGLNVVDLTTAINNTSILIGTGTQVAGNWGIYQADTDPNRLGGSLTLNNLSTGGAVYAQTGTGRLQLGSPARVMEEKWVAGNAMPYETLAVSTTTAAWTEVDRTTYTVGMARRVIGEVVGIRTSTLGFYNATVKGLAYYDGGALSAFSIIDELGEAASINLRLRDDGDDVVFEVRAIGGGTWDFSINYFGADI